MRHVVEYISKIFVGVNALLCIYKKWVKTPKLQNGLF